jgi:chromosome segregation ATPase
MVEEKENILREINNKLLSSEQEIARLNQQTQSQSVVIDRFEAELAKKISQIESLIRNQKDPNEIQNLQSQLESTTLALDTLRKAKANDEKSIIEITEKLRATQLRIEQLSSEKDQFIGSSSKDVENLKLALSEKEKELKTLMVTRPSPETVTRLERELEMLKQDNIELASSKQEKEASLDVLKNQLRNLEMQLVNSGGQSKQLLDSKEQEIITMKNKIVELENQLRNTNNSDANVEIVERLQRDIEEMRRVNKQYVDASVKGEVVVKALRDQLSEAETKIKDLEVARALLIRKKEENEKMIETLQSQLEGAKSNLAQSNGKVPENLQKIDQLQQRIAELEKSRKGLDEKIKTSGQVSVGELAKIDQYRNELSIALGELEQTKKAMKTQEAQYTLDMNKLQYRLAKSEADKKELSKFLNDTQEMTKSLKLSLDRSQKRILELDQIRIDLAIQEQALTGGQGEIANLLKVLDRELSKVISDLNFNSAALNFFLEMFKPRNTN